MSEDLKLGSIIEEPQNRDAVHIAVAPVFAGEDLRPGGKVFVGQDGEMFRIGLSGSKPIGVVDPYLRTGPKKGQQFWLFLYPGSITSLRHEWAHPAFTVPETEPVVAVDLKQKGEKRLQELALEMGLSYADVISRLDEALTDGSVYVGQDADQDMWNSRREDLFDSYFLLTGKRIDKETYFSCAC